MAEADPAAGPSRPRPEIFICLPKELDPAKQEVRIKIQRNLQRAVEVIKLRTIIPRSNLSCYVAIPVY